MCESDEAAPDAAWGAAGKNRGRRHEKQKAEGRGGGARGERTVGRENWPHTGRTGPRQTLQPRDSMHRACGARARVAARTNQWSLCALCDASVSKTTVDKVCHATCSRVCRMRRSGTRDEVLVWFSSRGVWHKWRRTP